LEISKVFESLLKACIPYNTEPSLEGWVRGRGLEPPHRNLGVMKKEQQKKIEAIYYYQPPGFESITKALRYVVET
jgi:hypothetical protein